MSRQQHSPGDGRTISPTVWVTPSGLVIRYRSNGKHRAETDTGRGLLALMIAPLAFLLLTFVTPWQVAVDAVALPRVVGPGPLSALPVPTTLPEVAEPTAPQSAVVLAVPVKHPIVHVAAPTVAASVLPPVATRPRRAALSHQPVPPPKDVDPSWPTLNPSPLSTRSTPVTATGRHADDSPLRLRVFVPALSALRIP